MLRLTRLRSPAPLAGLQIVRVFGPPSWPQYDKRPDCRAGVAQAKRHGRQTRASLHHFGHADP
jgi:hypothetical protein